MIAHFGLYMRRETTAAHQRLWQLTREALGDSLDAVPPKLNRDSDLWRIWRKPALLLAQADSLAYRSRLHELTHLVATPDHGLANTPAGHSYSLLLTHKDTPGDDLTAFHGTRLAYDNALSHPGWAAPILLAWDTHIGFADVIRSGSHLQSAEMLVQGQADLAAIDAVHWALMQRFDPISDQLRVVTKCPATPAAPFITARKNTAAHLFEALSSALAALACADRDLLMMQGLLRLPKQQYIDIPCPAGPRDYLASRQASSPPV